jgi:hypothetical protein
MKRSLAENVQKLVTEPKASNIASRKNALERFGDHARVSQAMKGKTGMGVIPEYALQSGADFQMKFPGVNPKVSAGLAAAYQTLQEGSRAILDGPGGVTLKDAYNTALDQTTKNIEGILAADTGTLTAKQQADRNKYLSSQGQPTETMTAATPTPDAGTTIPEYYRNNPANYDFDKFKAAYANATGMDDKVSITPEGQIVTDFGNYDPSRTYQSYMSNTQTSSNRPFFDQFEKSIERGDFNKDILMSMYGARW